MSLALFVYLAAVLPKVGAVLFFICAILMVVLLIAKGVCHVEDANFTANKLLVAAVFGLFFSLIIPSEKTMYMIGGANIVQSVAESPEVQKINTKVFKIINDKLDEFAKEEVKK